MYDDALHDHLLASGVAGSFMNKYNMGAIRQEMAWAFGETDVDSEAAFVQVEPGHLHDLLLNPGRKRLDEQTARAMRNDVQERYRRIPECRVAVLTMGMAEVWRDLQSGLILNQMPPARVMKDQPERFVLDVLSYDEVLGELNGIHALLASHGHPDVRLVLTVSPVPLLVTFRDQDVAIANTYSKSMQRAAAEAFSLTHGNVVYFPSYEIVTLTDRRLSYESDNRHVQASVVDLIVDRFVSLYVSDESIALAPSEIVASPVNDQDNALHVLRTAQFLESEGDPKGAAALYRRLITEFPERSGTGIPAVDHPDAMFQVRVSRLLIEAGDLPAAIEATDELVALAGNDASLILRALDLYSKAGSSDRMLGLIGSKGFKDLGLPTEDVEVRLAIAHLLARDVQRAAPLFARLLDGPLSETYRPRIQKGAEKLARLQAARTDKDQKQAL